MNNFELPRPDIGEQNPIEEPKVDLEERRLEVIRAVTDQNVSDKEAEKKYWDFMYLVLDTDQSRSKEFHSHTITTVFKHRPKLALKIEKELEAAGKRLR